VDDALTGFTSYQDTPYISVSTNGGGGGGSPSSSGGGSSGGAVGAVFGIGLAGAVVYVIYAKRKRAEQQKDFARMQGVVEGGAAAPPPPSHDDQYVTDGIPLCFFTQQITVAAPQPAQIIIPTSPLLGMDELSEDDKLVVARARKIQRFMSQPFQVAQVFTGFDGRFVKIEDTIIGFKRIIRGELDALPEQAFFMVGDIAEAVTKGERLIAEATNQKQAVGGGAKSSGPRKRRQGLKANLRDAEDSHVAASKSWQNKLAPFIEKFTGSRVQRKAAKAGAI